MFHPHKAVILRAYDFFSILRVFRTPAKCASNSQQNRHPERSASQIYRKQAALLRGVEGPRRRGLSDAFGSFPAANYTGRKNLTSSERSAWSHNTMFHGAESKSLSRAWPREPRRCLSCLECSGLFNHPSPRTGFLTAVHIGCLQVHPFQTTVIVFQTSHRCMLTNSPRQPTSPPRSKQFSQNRHFQPRNGI